MSRSNNVVTKTPCVRFFEWSGSEGKLRYYDREAKKNELVDLPITFLVLDRLHTVGGYCDAERSGFWANEVRDVSRDVLTVRTKSGVVTQGAWKQLPAITGLKYAQSIYIAFKDKGTLVIGNIKASGAFVSAWIEFTKSRNIYDGAMAITGATEERKGATKYYAPVFAARSVSPETDTQAKALDITLQEYLTTSLQRQAQLAAGDVPVAAGMSTNGGGNGYEPEVAPFAPSEPPDDWEDQF